MLLTKVISTVPRALLRPISKQRCRRRKGPRWSVRRALPQAIGSLIHPDLSRGAVSLPEDLTPRRLSSPCYGGLRVRIPLAPARSLRTIGTAREKAGDGQPYPALAALHQMAELARQPSTGHCRQPNSHRPSCLNTARLLRRGAGSVFGVPGL